MDDQKFYLSYDLNDLNSCIQNSIDVTLINKYVSKNKKYEAKQFSYAAATLLNAISDDGLNNSEHVDDLKKRIENISFQEILIFG